MATPWHELTKQGQDERLAASKRLYEQYGKPLEAEHWGEFVAIAGDGRYVLGTDSHEVTRRAVKELGRGTHMYKVGPRVMGRGPRSLRRCE